MENSKLIIEERSLVGDVLAVGPKAVEFFLERRLDCAGCSMASFCTLAEVAKNYELPLDEFLQDLENALQG